MEGKANGGPMINQFNILHSDSVRARVKTRRRKLTDESPLLETNLNGHKKIRGLKAMPAITEFDTSPNGTKSPKHF